MKFLNVISILFISVVLFSCTNENTESKQSDKDTTKDTLQSDSDKLVKDTFKLGESAQIIIRTNKYNETVKFYETVGWKVRKAGKKPFNWTNMFDGSIGVMIVEDPNNSMGIGYNTPNAIEVCHSLENKGDQLVSKLDKGDGTILFKSYIGNDSVSYSIVNQKSEKVVANNVADILSKPDEALTFPNPIFGSFQEFAVSVENLEEAVAYWEKRGFKSNGISDGPYRYTIMYDGLMIIGLHETKGMWYGELLTYSGHGVEENNKVAEDLKKAGYKDVEMLEFGGQVMDGNYIIHDPAGNALMMTTDFSKMKK